MQATPQKMNTSNKRLRTESEGPPGDRRSASTSDTKPQLTRACAECKRHKIKCFVQPGQASCNKCLRSGIRCVPHNFAQKFIDGDAEWKAQATATMTQLTAAVDHLLHHNNLPGLGSFAASTTPAPRPPQESSVTAVSPSVASNSNSAVPGNFTAEGPSADLQEDDSDLVPLPMNNLYSLTEPAKSQLIRVDPSYVNGPDFISRGVVSLEEAEFLFDHYMTRINPLLWDGILCSHKTLQAARESSGLLVATVLTIAAMHIPGRQQSLQTTYDAFVSLMRASCLLRSQNLDDVRGLCIGAFYLTSLSWALCSRAIRVATEMNLHKSSLQFARGGSLESYERVQLWYVLYVCDHQFALAYGRPPMMHDDSAIRNADKLLTSGLSSKGDQWLVAQVKLFRILAGAYFMYGCDPDLELGGQDYEMMQSFNISLDQWRLEQQPKSDDLIAARVVHPKGTTLYYHLARFQLNSLSLRGISAKGTSQDQLDPNMNWERREAANNAIAAAASTVRLIVEDGDLRKLQIGMPIFVHAMIAVCASFLLKMAVVFSESDSNGGGFLHLPRDLGKYGLNFHTKNALTDVESLVRVLGQVADNASQQHVARQVVTGLRELLQRFRPGLEPDSYVYSRSSGAPAAIPAGAAGVPAGQGGMHAGYPRDAAAAAAAAQPGHSGFGSSYAVVPAGNGQAGGQADSLDYHQDPFNLMGDLDWRFNDAFLWGIQAEEPFM